MATTSEIRPKADLVWEPRKAEQLASEIIQCIERHWSRHPDLMWDDVQEAIYMAGERIRISELSS